MNLFVWQILFVVSIFTAVIICCLIPILLMRNAYTDAMGPACSRVLSWFNCLTGGVFLAMCFLGLLPNVQEQIAAVLRDYQWTTSFPLAECVVLTGFFIVLAIDQASKHCEKSKPAATARKVIEMNSIGVEEYDEQDGLGLQDDLDDAQCTLLGNSDQDTYTGDLPSLGNGGPAHTAKYNNRIEGSGTDRGIPSRTQRPRVALGSTGSHCHSHDQVLNLMETTPRGLHFIVLLFALSMHALFEGIVLGLQRDVPKAVHLFTAIILHEAVVAATLGFNIAKAKHSVWTAVRYSLLFSVTIPIGIGLGMGIGQTPGTVGHLISGGLQGMAAGIFLHITFMQLLPDEFSNHKGGLIKTLFLFIGFLLLMTLNLVMGGEHLPDG